VTASGDRRYKALFIPAWYPSAENPTAGGFVREHAQAVSLYDDVTVLYVQTVPPLRGSDRFSWREQMDDGIPTVRLRVPHIKALSYTLAVLAAYHRLALRGYRPDVIHAHEYIAGLPAVLIGRLHRIPVVVTEHFTGFVRRTLGGVRLQEARIAFRWADAVMPVSRSLQRAIEDYGIKARFEVVPNAVDTDLFRPGDRDGKGGSSKRLLFVGLLDPSHKKGVPHLLQALAILRERRDDWQLDIVGDGPARTEYQRAAAELGIGEKVTFQGLKSKPGVAQYMRQADVFVLPSLWENLPCVLIEAMASGLPIVSTLTGGIPEMIDGETGILVPPGDAAELAAALERMMGSLDEYDSGLIVEKARQYSHQSVGGRIHSVYKEHVRR